MADILITGGAGNFGRTLASGLRKQELSLCVFDLTTCDFSFFDGWRKTQIIKGDILDIDLLKKALDGVKMVFHLAAILPPESEKDRGRTFMVNVNGVRNLVEACSSKDMSPNIIFTSSVSVYGDKSDAKWPIRPGDSVSPNDWYAESKVKAERIIIGSGLPYVNLRISGIVIPAFLDPPEPWPFMRNQRIELLTLSDLTDAMVALVETGSATGRTLLLSGGPDWRVSGKDYVKTWGEIMGVPFDEMRFMDRPGWLNWYDTTESQMLLNYQKTSMADFFQQLKIAVEEALA